MATFIAVCLFLTALGALGAAILVHRSTQRARTALAREQDELVEAAEFAHQKITAEHNRLREEVANEQRRARQQMAAEQERAREQLDLLLAQIEQARVGLTRLQQEAQGFRARHTEYEQVVSRLCDEVGRTLPVFVSALERTPTADAELIRQVYFLNDRFSKIRNGLLEARGLVEAGVVGHQPVNRRETGWGGPQGHLSAQWHD